MLATAMFRHAWDQRRNHAKQIILTGKRQIKDIEKPTEALLARIMQTANAAVIGTYEDRIGQLEHEKLLLAEKLQNQAEPKGTFEEKLEPVLKLLANPWKLWENGNTVSRRTVLKLAFTNPIQYDRKSEPSPSEVALPFKALTAIPKGSLLWCTLSDLNTSLGRHLNDPSAIYRSLTRSPTTDVQTELWR